MPPQKLTVTRKGQERTFNVTLGTLPDQREARVTPEAPRQRGTNVPQLGLSVAPQPGGGGVVVSNVDPEGTAAEHGLRNGDVIVEVSRKKVATAGDVRHAIDAAQKSGKKSVLLRIKSGTSMKFVAVRVNRG